MKTVQFSRLGEPADVLEVQEVPTPAPGPGQVRVRLTARAIHPSDLMNVRGLYGRPPPLPFCPGNDAAGTVDAVGPEVKGFKVGDRVMLLLGATGGRGTWMEQVVVPAQMLVPTPAALSDAQAGALWVNYLSIWVMAVELLQVPQGGLLLQTAAGSQLGRAMMELARLRGFGLVNVVRRREQAEELKALGAENVVCTADERLPERVRALTGGKGVHWAIDAVGGTTGAQVVESLAVGGRCLLFGALDGRAISLEPGPVLFKELVIQGFWLTRWLQATPPERVRPVLETIIGHAVRGDFKPAIDQSFPLAQVKEAVVRAETPGRTGSVVLVP
ncbi:MULTISPECIES: zinc-dependent alcohol dehydrogenase family protein [Myxococcaceae]|uniref:zinc-dependent alcohol dehydrogenase family protein n=1 Tax=Myxococcaceae TaxID=31 RepID=UPI00188F8ACC|nr:MULTISPECIES: zinc-dependent alcohol dehydrogenase family protein [Myxococcaceae]MBF5043238.1 zinc-dependent alcohol dehydrogenase family protein [Simulacricoccus sp. 17bor-14]